MRAKVPNVMMAGMVGIGESKGSSVIMAGMG